MKIKEMFKKVEGYNELAELMRTTKAHVYFAQRMTACITDGEAFTSYDEFRKYIRREYFKDTVDFILNSDSWEINSDNEFTNAHGHVLEFEVYIEQN